MGLKKKGGAPRGNNNAAGPHKDFGSIDKAVKAFGPRPGGLFNIAAKDKHDNAVDNWLGHSSNKRLVKGRVLYKIAKKKDVKKWSE
jgi:hypothetical protein